VKVQVSIKVEAFEGGVIPIIGEYMHDDVYVLSERDGKHILFKRGGGELEYPVSLYDVKEY